jgi:hypothetical protein
MHNDDFPLIQRSDETLHQAGAAVARSFAPPVAGLLEGVMPAI